MNPQKPISFQGGSHRHLVVSYPRATSSPILHLSLLVLPSRNLISGCAEILQELPGKYGQLFIQHVSGTFTHLHFSKTHQLIYLNGTYFQDEFSNNPTEKLQQLKVLLALDSNWEGKGSFFWGESSLEDLQVVSLDPDEDLSFPQI